MTEQHSVAFPGALEFSSLLNKLVNAAGLTWFARFDGNAAPMTLRLIEEVPALGRSHAMDSGFMSMDMAGGRYLWAVLASGEYEGGLTFTPVPDDISNLPTGMSRWGIELSDWLRKNCAELTIISRGTVSEASMAEFSRRGVPIPASTLMRVLTGEE